jgi:hypothetical protein
MGRLTVLELIRDQYWKVEPAVHVDLTGKTVVIVGANVGLGFETAKHFASMNPRRLVLGCRSQDKGQAALRGERAFYRTSLLLFLSLFFKPYKPPVSKMLSWRWSTSPVLRPFRHLGTRSFVMVHR